MANQQYNKIWQEVVVRVAEEWTGLPRAEKKWVAEHVLHIVHLQERLHQLFLEVGGAIICRDCDGDCCGHGKFHPTLVNLLACLVTEQPFPDVEFEQHCPYLGAAGCQFPPGLRPYNCISFICEQVENRLNPENQDEFYRLEKEIRKKYELFAGRYVGAGMRGILIKGETLPSYLTHR